MPCSWVEIYQRGGGTICPVFSSMKEAALLLTFVLPFVEVSERLDASVFTAETWNIRDGPY